MSDTVINRVRSFFKRQARSFRMARAGNVAMIFALSAVPVLIAGGAGIDLARALAVRARMYEAVDAAALAVATKPGLTTAQATDMAQKYFDANFNMNSSYGTPAPLTVTVVGQQVDVSSNIAMPTTIMRVAGFENVNLTAASKVVWGQTKIWVGLALDNTGSMSQGDSGGSKLAALKLAVNGDTTHPGLIDMLRDASANPGDVKMSMIPFAQAVNVGTGKASETWIDWSEWDQSHGSCSLGTSSSYNTKSKCITSGSCSISGKTTKSDCETSTVSACSANPGTNNTQAKCLAVGTCNLSGNTSKSTCEAAGACTLSAYTTQANCLAAGTCTISGKTTKSSCETAYSGSCSVSTYTNQTACTGAGTCNIAGYTTKANCQAAYNGYVCKINGVSYTDSNHDTSAECTNSANGVCSKTPASTYNTKSKCQQSPNAGTWYVGAWTGVGGQGVWTPFVWTTTYGVWTATPGTWNFGVWTSANLTWVTTYGVWTLNNGVWTPTRTAWNGCITDRGPWSTLQPPANSGFDVSNAAPDGTPEGGFPATTLPCPKTVTSLGNDWTTLKTSVTNLTASGSTNQTIGLAWAWHSLTDTAPMNSGALPTNTTRYIIIISDGENTANRWDGNGQDHSQLVDDRMKLACDAAKASGVIVWSVFVNIGGTAGNADSMKKCATGYVSGMLTDPSHYFSVTSTSGIGTALNIIGQQITNLRVAH